MNSLKLSCCVVVPICVCATFCSSLYLYPTSACPPQDYIRPLYNVPDSRVGLLVKLLALVFGAACVALAFLADILGTGVLQVRRILACGWSILVT